MHERVRDDRAALDRAALDRRSAAESRQAVRDTVAAEVVRRRVTV